VLIDPLWIKAFHIMAVIAWMAGIFYLPRLYVYHAEAEPGGEASETFKVMEEKLLRIIMNPAMLVTWALGLLAAWQSALWTEAWFIAKLVLVIAMTVFHMMLARWRKEFAADANTRSHKFYRIANEVPTLLMFAIVLLAVVRPF